MTAGAGKETTATNTVCLICDASMGVSTRKCCPIFIFEQCVSSSNRTIVSVINSIFDDELTEEKVHSNVICKKCFKACNEVDELEERLDELKSELKSSYQRTLKKQSSGGKDSESVVTEEKIEQKKNDSSPKKRKRGRPSKKEIPGLTDKTVPRRLGPKRASKIRKLFNLTKEDDVRKFVIKRPLPLKEGQTKPKYKKPKIQRLVTPLTLQRKRHQLALKKRRALKRKKMQAEYAKLLAIRQKEKTARKKADKLKRLSTSSKSSSIRMSRRSHIRLLEDTSMDNEITKSINNIWKSIDVIDRLEEDFAYQMSKMTIFEYMKNVKGFKNLTSYEMFVNNRGVSADFVINGSGANVSVSKNFGGSVTLQLRLETKRNKAVFLDFQLIPSHIPASFTFQHAKKFLNQIDAVFGPFIKYVYESKKPIKDQYAESKNLAF